MLSLCDLNFILKSTKFWCYKHSNLKLGKRVEVEI